MCLHVLVFQSIPLYFSKHVFQIIIAFGFKQCIGSFSDWVYKETTMCSIVLIYLWTSLDCSLPSQCTYLAFLLFNSLNNLVFDYNRSGTSACSKLQIQTWMPYMFYSLFTFTLNNSVVPLGLPSDNGDYYDVVNQHLASTICQTSRIFG